LRESGKCETVPDGLHNRELKGRKIGA